MSVLEPPRRAFNESENHRSNTVKLEHWCDMVGDCDDGDEILLIDADTFILQPIDVIWERPFDVAYTVRPPDYPQPLNAGVVFVRVSPASRQFLEQWRVANVRMLTDRRLQYAWRRYQGMNQRALGMLLEQGVSGVMLAALPCAEWNCEDSSWSSFRSAVTRIVHVKSALREAVLPGAHRPPSKPHLKAIARIWHVLEAAALVEAGRA